MTTANQLHRQFAIAIKLFHFRLNFLLFVPVWSYMIYVFICLQRNDLDPKRLRNSHKTFQFRIFIL